MLVGVVIWPYFTFVAFLPFLKYGITWVLGKGFEKGIYWLTTEQYSGIIYMIDPNSIWRGISGKYLRMTQWNSPRAFWPNKCHCCPHIETSQLICCANQLTGFYMRATLVLNRLITWFFREHCEQVVFEFLHY